MTLYYRLYDMCACVGNNVIKKKIMTDVTFRDMTAHTKLKHPFEYSLTLTINKIKGMFDILDKLNYVLFCDNLLHHVVRHSEKDVCRVEIKRWEEYYNKEEIETIGGSDVQQTKSL